MDNLTEINHVLRTLITTLKHAESSELYENRSVVDESLYLFKQASIEFHQLMPAGEICQECKGSGVATY
ncbi:MAG: hypothetical protein ACI83B_001829 [Sediminicola sp.]|jgi:hypothetical protein